jgi:hypothetical protein
MQSKRINRGLYEVTSNGHTFHVEDIGQASDGEIPPAWMLYEVKDNGHREFWNDFCTKREAIAAILEETN